MVEPFAPVAQWIEQRVCTRNARSGTWLSQMQDVRRLFYPLSRSNVLESYGQRYFSGTSLAGKATLRDGDGKGNFICAATSAGACSVVRRCQTQPIDTSSGVARKSLQPGT